MDTLHVIGTGCEGIDELRASLDDACVQWALLKLDMGSGAFLRQKILFLHMNGANCPAVRRGCVNEQTGEAQRLLCGEECFHASLEVTHKSQVTEEYIRERVRNFFIVDDLGDHSTQWLKRQSSLGRPGYKRHKTAPDVWAGDLTRKVLWPGHYSTMPFKSGREALKSVADGGLWNWCLVGPDPQLSLVSGGSGAFDELRSYLMANRTSVYFGVLRLGFGVGRLRRVKHIFIHAIGEQASAVRRGRHNAARPAVEKALSDFVNCVVPVQITRVEDFTLESVVERLRRSVHVDDDLLDNDLDSRRLFTVEAVREALREERRAAIFRTPLPKAQARKKPRPDLPVEEAVRLVHAPGHVNWAVFGPREVKMRRSTSMPVPGVSRVVPVRRPSASPARTGYGRQFSFPRVPVKPLRQEETHSCESTECVSDEEPSDETE